ncbi:MAG: single-stranded DNA-binding protein [Candidatus Nanopelagicales bacterium]
MPGATTAAGRQDAVNEVRLRGRLSGDPEERELPSGDLVVVLRLVVDRPEGARASHDTLDCAAYSASVRRKLLRWGHGDVVEVTGALHRRFFRAGAVPVSRYEVEVGAATRVSAASAGSGRRGTMAG